MCMKVRRSNWGQTRSNIRNEVCFVRMAGLFLYWRILGGGSGLNKSTCVYIKYIIYFAGLVQKDISLICITILRTNSISDLATLTCLQRGVVSSIKSHGSRRQSPATRWPSHFVSLSQVFSDGECVLSERAKKQNENQPQDSTQVLTWMNIKYRYPNVSNKSRRLAVTEVGPHEYRNEIVHPMLPAQTDLRIFALKIS